MIRRATLTGLVALTLAYPVLPTLTSRALLATVIRALAIAAVVGAVTIRPVRKPSMWWLLAGALAAIAVAFLLGALRTSDVLGVPSVVDRLVLLAGYGLLLAAATAVIRARRSAAWGGDIDALLDASVVAVVAVLALAQFTEASHTDLLDTATGVTAVLIAVAVAVVGFRVFLDRDVPVSLWLLGAATLSLFAGAAAVAITNESPFGPAGLAGVLWMVPNVFVAAAALHPDMVRATEPALRRHRAPLRRKPRVPRMPMVVVSFVAPTAVAAIASVARVPLDLATFSAGAGLLAVLGFMRIRRALVAWDRSEWRLETILDHSLEGIAILDPDGRVVFEGGETARLLGVGVDGNVFESVHPDDVTHAATLFADLLGRSGSSARTELRTRAPDGSWAWVEVAAVNRLDDPHIRGVVTTYRDITARRDAETALARRALHDPLTGLPNRDLLMDRLQEALHRSSRQIGQVAVLFCDLDRFKLVNDSLGHAVGDALLVEVAERLRHAVRPADTVARFGGDEFVVICEGVTGAEDAGELAQRLLASLESRVALAGTEVPVSASIGVSIGSGSDATAESMIRNADSAMYRAKDRGRHRYALFDETLWAAAQRRIEVERELHEALERDELIAFYQPVVAAGTGMLTGFEALVRWDHPRAGLLEPAVFLTVAEESGLIVPLGRRMLRAACRQLAHWQAAYPGRELSMAVNVSPRELSAGGFINGVVAALSESQIHPGDLVLEVTENALVDEESTAVLRAIRDLGVQLALDDFGTGYSSLSYLATFRVDRLKIDRSFVADLDGAGGAVVGAVIGVAHALKLRVVAEGVENERQLATLVRLGADEVQGFLFGRPVSAVALAGVLEHLPAA